MSIVPQSPVVCIYALIDPRTNQVRYIGKANEPSERLRQHISSARRQESHKARWIKELLALNLQPVLKVLEETTGDAWEALEVKWIADARRLGWPLTNYAAGGRAGGRVKGWKHTEEAREKISRAVTGRRNSPESMAKIADALRGRKRPPEVAEKIAAANRARKGAIASDETREKLRLSHLGHKQTQETKDKRAASNRGKKRSAEYCQEFGISRSRLTLEQATAIRQLHADGHSIYRLARMFDVGEQTIRRIVKNQHKFAYKDDNA